MLLVQLSYYVQAMNCSLVPWCGPRIPMKVSWYNTMHKNQENETASFHAKISCNFVLIFPSTPSQLDDKIDSLVIKQCSRRKIRPVFLSRNDKSNASYNDYKQHKYTKLTSTRDLIYFTTPNRLSFILRNYGHIRGWSYLRLKFISEHSMVKSDGESAELHSWFCVARFWGLCFKESVES